MAVYVITSCKEDHTEFKGYNYTSAIFGKDQDFIHSKDTVVANYKKYRTSKDTKIYVVEGDVAPFIKTNPDNSKENNILKLPTYK